MQEKSGPDVQEEREDIDISFLFKKRFIRTITTLVYQKLIFLCQSYLFEE